MSTYGHRSIAVHFVLGGDAEASVVAAGGPGQSDGRLQRVVDFLVNGAAELCAVVPETKTTKDMRCHTSFSMTSCRDVLLFVLMTPRLTLMCLR